MRKNFQCSFLTISVALILLQLYLHIYHNSSKDEHLHKFFEREKSRIADQLIAQQPVAAASRTKILGIHPPKIPDEHAGLINGDIQSIEAEAKENGVRKRFPDFIVMGMQKCGTTALQYFMNFHPGMRSPVDGEVHFFEREGNYRKGYKSYFDQMPYGDPGLLIFEKTPDYMHDPKVPSRMFHFKPELKLIAVVCDPVHRAFSHYLHALNITRPQGWQMPGAQELKHKTFEEVVFQALAETINATMAKALIQLPEDQVPYEEIRAKFHRYLDNGMRTGRRYLMPASILARSSYGYLLAHWYRYFPREQILVVDGNDLKVRPAHAMQRIQEFLGAEQYLTEKNFHQMPDTGFYCIQARPDSDCLIPGGNKGRSAKTHMDAPVETVLRRFFRALEPDNLEVFDGMPFSWSADLMNAAADKPADDK